MTDCGTAQVFWVGGDRGEETTKKRQGFIGLLYALITVHVFISSISSSPPSLLLKIQNIYTDQGLNMRLHQEETYGGDYFPLLAAILMPSLHTGAAESTARTGKRRVKARRGIGH